MSADDPVPEVHQTAVARDHGTQFVLGSGEQHIHFGSGGARGPARPPAYWATVAEIRRRTGVLAGREGDLARIASFAAGNAGYLWLSGEAGAGKTALLAESVSVPPDDTDVVCYFLSRRETDADSTRFLVAVVPQLAYLLGEDPPAAGVHEFRALWQRAIVRAEGEVRRLLLVVDGLDEDMRMTGLPSVAALLPSAAGGRVHVLVSSRANWHLPDDAPAGHPLRQLDPVPVEPFAGPRELALLARQAIAPVPPETRSAMLSLQEGDAGVRADVAAVMRAQVRAADELPYRLFGVRRPPLSSVYVRQSLDGGVALPGAVPTGARCGVEEALARHRHLIVFGGPGQGKSTLTLQLVHRFARDWLVNDSSSAERHRDLAELLPLRVTGRGLAATIGHPWLRALREAAGMELGSHLDLETDFAPDLLKRPVGATPWLIVIDGIDEAVEPGRRDELITVLSARLADTGLPHRLLITSRPLPPAEMARLCRSAEVSDVGVYELEAFSGAALQDLARRWLTSGAQPPEADPAVRFLAEARAAGLTAMLSTPLLALMAIVLFEQDPQGVLPRSQFDLYERYLDYVLAATVRHPDWQAATAQLAELGGDSGRVLREPATVEALHNPRRPFQRRLQSLHVPPRLRCGGSNLAPGRPQ